MGGCSVLGCKRRSEKKRDNNVTFHSFPKDNNKRKIWIEATGRQDWEPNKFSKICSIHFNRDAVCFVNKVKRINPEAIPTKNLNAPFDSSDEMETIEIKSTSSEESHSSQDFIRDQIQSIKGKPVTTPTSKRKHILPRKKPCMTAPRTPRKERLLKLKLEKCKEQSAERLRKLRAMREAKRRLMKKNAHLQTIIAELQCKINMNSSTRSRSVAIDGVCMCSVVKFEED